MQVSYVASLIIKIDAKRQRVSDLLCAQVNLAEIVKIVGVSKTMVYDTKKKLEAGDNLERKPGSGGNNKILTDEFLGLQVGAKEYLEVIRDIVKSWMDATYPDGNYC
ncbi:Uncharacterized protein FKW44_006028 [Caligus rogercresseyi]|uniref:Uncharacterized protein n=1 Tax=Caligus rogercresseyi TaxID=217165 RepID=A0A7T8KCS6_CALRO|nr:Uncharacterized protein FKW44_006028 [Caligus rogercresseyi]